MSAAAARRLWTRSALACLCTALVVSLGLVTTSPSPSVVADEIVPFGIRFQANDNGTIAIFGNNLLTCPASTACTNIRNGTTAGGASNNNNNDMVNLDQDGAAFATFNSSSSQVILPQGSSVLFAGLYWGARRTGGQNGSTTTNPIGQMSLRLPGEAAYRMIPTEREFGPTTTADAAYQQFANVTTLVQGAGAGEYWGANVAAGTGRDRYAGWSLVVVYRDPTQPLRNLTVFDGFSDVGQNDPETITISGFLTPLTGTVGARLGVVAYEGDKGSAGDEAFLNTTRLGTNLSSGTNFFNSANDLDGAHVTTRQPADQNMLGFDIKQLGVPDAIPNGARSATVSLSSTSERYFPGVVTTAIRLYAPDFTTSRKAVTNLVGRDPAAVGDILEYTLTYTNSGQDPAASSVASDPLPPNTTYVPGSIVILTGPNAGAKTDAPGDDQAEFLAASRTVRVRLGTGASSTAGGVIAPGATTSVRFRVTVDPAAPGTTLLNRASLAYVAQTIGSPFTYVGNETATPVAENANLSITKTTTPEPAVAGADITSTIAVTNAGPNTAVNVVVTDTLSDGVTATSATPSVGTCLIAGQVVTCNLGNLASGASATVAVVGRAPPSSDLTNFTNRAEVGSNTIDPSPSNNTAATTIDVVRRADVAVTKGGPATVTPGDTVTFPITVTNNGPSAASTVGVSDHLPAGLTPESTTGPCEIQASSVQCSFGDLAPGASGTATITARVDPSTPAGSLFSNTASASSLTPDPVEGNNAATATFTTGASQTDLAVTKTVDPASVVAGAGGATYTVTVTNNGPSDATGVIVTDPVTSGFPVTSVSSSRGDCAAGPPVSCTIGALPVGATATITLAIAVGPDATPGPVANTATVAGAQTDPNTTNNTAAATVTVAASADIFTIKQGTSPLAPGTEAFYQITVANLGPSVAREVTIVDPIPAGLVFHEVTFPGAGSCDPFTPPAPLTCQLGDIAPGDFVELVIDLDVPPDYDGADITNTATASSPTPDLDSSNNTSSFTSSTGPQADIFVVKTQDPTPPVAGSAVSWDLSAFNNGPSTAAGVVITDQLPTGLTGIILPAGCTFLGVLEVACTVGSLPPGPSPTFTIQATVPAETPAGTPLANTATVDSSTPDPAPSGNTATVRSEVSTEADLTVTKVTDTPSAPAGAGLPTFTISVGNGGPSVARDVQLTDTLPFDAIIEEVTGAACTISGVSVECAVGDLAPGASVDIVITYFTRTSVTPGDYTNVASASSSTPESDPSDNDGSVTVEVLPPSVDVTLAKTGTPDVVAGGRFDYEIDVQNGGPSTAFDVVVTDELPIGFTPDVATTEFGDCTIAGQTVTCNIPFVYEPPFEDFNSPVLISGTVSPDAPASVVNAATAETVEPDSDPTNNTSSTTTTTRRESDVTVDKQLDPLPVFAGGEVSYTVTVTNAGPSAAPDAVVTDILPDGVTFLPGSSDGRCVLAGTDVVCSLGTVPAGGAVVLRVSGRLDPNLPAGSIVNTAIFSSSATDPNPADNTAIADTPVEISADLAATKAAAIGTIIAGSNAIFNVTVTNDGPSTARGVELLDTVPPGTTLVSIVPTPTVPCTGATCAIGDLLPGQSVSAVVTVAVPPSHPPGPITNVVNASSPTPDPNPGRRLAQATAQVSLLADVEVVKTLITSPIVAGQPVTYGFTVTNHGPSDAVNTTLVDPFPPGTFFVGGTAPPGTVCDVSLVDAPAVSCILPVLAVGQTVTGTLTLATDPTLAGTLSNTAVVGSEALDRIDANNTSTATGAIVAADSAVDLVVTKTGPASLAAGGTFAYELTVANAGVSLSTGGTVTDTLPTGLVPTAATIGGAACSIAGQTVTCPTGLLPPGAPPVALAISGTVDPNIAGDTVTNTATGTPVGTETDPTDNSAASTATISRQADLSITKTANSPPFTAGGTIGYTLTVANGGPAAAPGTVITDTLPAGVTFDAAASDDRCTVATPPSGISCAVGTVANGATVALTLGGRLASGFTAISLANTAAVVSDATDPNGTDNTSTIDTPVARSADLSITKVADAVEFVAGTAVGYTITVSNAGPSSATGVTVSETLPPGVTFDPVGSDSRCSVTAPPSGVTCTLGTVAVLGSVALDIAGTLDQDAPAGPLRNAVTVASTTGDPDGADNASSIDTPVRRSADLSLAKTISPATPAAGGPITFTLTITNAGPSSANGTLVTDPLDPAITITGATSSQGTCATPLDGIVTCDLGRLDAAGTASVTITGTLSSDFTGGLGNTATITSSDPDPNPLDNTRSISVDTDAAADLTISKVLLAELVAGGQSTYRLTIVNRGPATARNVAVTDSLDPNLTFVSASAGECAPASVSAIVCGVGDLPVGGRVTVDVVVDVAVGAAGSIPNTAAVAAATRDPVTGNNATVVDELVTQEADLTLTKEANTPTATPGGQAQFTVTVTNAGPSVAEDVVVADALPAGMTLLSLDPSPDRSCTAASCIVGDMAPGDTFSMVVVARIDAAVALGPLTNVATVSSPTPGPDPDERSVSAEMMIVAPPAQTTTTTTTIAGTTTTASGTTTTVRQSAGGGGRLPLTGSDGGAVVVAAAGLLSLGAVLRVITKRRRTPRTP